MKVTKQTISPEYAKDLLNLSVGNRTISEFKVSQYAHDMRIGRWIEDTYELIKISKEGFLLDGHHRLSAIIRANIPISMGIVWGVDPIIMGVIDTGKSRNANDALKIHGVANSASIASIISSIIRHELGYSVTSDKSKVAAVSNVDIINRYESDSEYWQSLHLKSVSIYSKLNRIITSSMIGKYYHLFSQKHPDKVDLFFSKLIGGNDSSMTIDLLRTTLIRNKISQKKISTTVLNAIIIKTWNAYITNSELKVLKFDIINSEMPIIK
jgi:hypothetical protein